MLTVQGVRCSNPGIAAQCIEDPTEPPSVVLLRPELLNSGEWLDMKFVTAGELKKAKIDVRFAGQSDQAADLRRRRHRLGRIAGGLAFLAFIGVQVYFFIFVTHPRWYLTSLTLAHARMGVLLNHCNPHDSFGCRSALVESVGRASDQRGTADEDDDFDDEDETE